MDNDNAAALRERMKALAVKWRKLGTANSEFARVLCAIELETALAEVGDPENRSRAARLG